MIYFTSDLHFFHSNVIEYSDRPFKDVEEMNIVLMSNWNETIGKDDEVYILGDLTMKGPVYANDVLGKLNGRKHLIRGNHDSFLSKKEFNKGLLISAQDYAEIAYGGARFILFHYPILEWSGFFRGSIHLHGHQHNKAQYNIDNREHGIRRFDVGVDANGMMPVSADSILKFFGLGEQG